MMRSLLIVALLCIAACAAPFDMPAADRAAMNARVVQFERDFAANNIPAVVDVLPPKVQAVIARRTGLSVAQTRRTTIDQLRKVSKLVQIVSYDMDVSKAALRQTSTGRGYALIPTQTVVRAPNGQLLQNTTQTLAFADEGSWYLVRIEDERQRQLLAEAYPEFATLSTPKGTTKVIQ